MNAENERPFDFAEQIEQMIPENLDDIIRKNRELAHLRLATDDEIMELYHPIKYRKTKAVFNDWRMINLYINAINQPQVILMGNIGNGIIRLTSTVMQVDLDRGLVITKSGSLYSLGKPGLGEPPHHQLMAICAVFHEWGFGAVFGVPHFFY